MKRATLFILTAFVFQVFSFAQNRSKKVEIDWGQIIENKKSYPDIDVLGYDENNVYVTRTESKGLRSTHYIERFDERMNRQGFELLNMKTEGKERDLYFSAQLKDNLYVYSTFENKKLEKTFLFVQQINKETLKPEGDLKKIAERPNNQPRRMIFGIGTGSRFSDWSRFDKSISRDRSKVAIYYNIPNEKEEQESFGFHVFDENMDLLWEKEVELPYNAEKFDKRGLRVDDDGNVYLLGRLYEETAKERKKEAPNYTYELIYYTNKGQSSDTYTFELSDDEKFITDLQFEITKEKDIICAGFYSENLTKKGIPRGTSIKGSFFLKVDGDTKAIISQSDAEFGIDFITQNLSEKAEKKVKKKEKAGKTVELYEYDLDDIILRDDGGAVLVGEQFFIQHLTVSDGRGGFRTKTIYNYNDIIVININPDGKIEWQTKVGKRQRSSFGSSYCSYALAVVQDKLYFVFNDHPDNINYKGEGKIKTCSYFDYGTLVVLIEVNRNGEQDKEALFLSEDAQTVVQPLQFEQISKNEMILFGTSEKRKKRRFAKLIF